MIRIARRRRLAALAGLLALATTATSHATANTHDALWRPWTHLLSVDPYELPDAIGRLEGITPSRHCAGATTDLAAAVTHLGVATGQAEALTPGLVLDPTAAAYVARLTDCLAIAMTHLPLYDGEKLGPAPDALRAEWLGATADLLALAQSTPRLLLPVSCVDVLCLVQTGGTGNDTYTVNAALIVDSGGADIYRNNAGGGYLLPAAALVLDQGAGNDQYVPTVSDLYGNPTIGAGYEGGVGIVVDQGGTDTYRGIGGTMGAAFAGAGALLDLGSGWDLYDSPWAAGSNYGQSHKVDHGAGAYGGFGILFDEAGNDRYVNNGVDSLGWGGAAGTGLLIDVAGSDTYTVNTGATGDVTGGCCVTVSGVSLGTGEVGGYGVVLDGGGNDSYACTGLLTYGCEGASYTGVLGLLFDAGGNDSYSLPPVNFALPSFAPGGLGSGGLGGVGVFADVSGTDTYSGTAQSGGFGEGGAGVFLDLGGTFDSYGGFMAPLVGTRGNNSVWADGLGVGVGIDR